MSNYAVAEVKAALNFISWSEIEYQPKGFRGAIMLLGEATTYEKVDSHSGGEGDYGCETWVVVKVGDQLFKKTGFYQSHYGNDWDGAFTEVRQGRKTVTVYTDL